MANVLNIVHPDGSHEICLGADPSEDVFKTCFGLARSERPRRRCCVQIARRKWLESKAAVSKLINGEDITPAEQQALANDLLCKRHQAQQSNILTALRKTFIQLAARFSELPPIPPPSTKPPISAPAASPAICIQPYHSPDLTTEKVIDGLVKLAKSELGKNVKPGILYVFKYSDDITNGYLKIGYTVRTIQDRMEETKKCKKIPIVIDDAKQRTIKHAFRAEQLAFNVLSNCRRKMKGCACDTVHQEWFQVDEDTALRVIEKVRQFIEEYYGPISQDETTTHPSRRAKFRLAELVEMSRQLALHGKLSPPQYRASPKLTSPEQQPSPRCGPSPRHALLQYLQNRSRQCTSSCLFRQAVGMANMPSDWRKNIGVSPRVTT